MVGECPTHEKLGMMTTFEEYAQTWDEEDWKSYDEQLPAHPNLGRTTWTPQQIKALSDTHDKHHFNCKKCRSLLGSNDDSDKCDHQNCKGECYLQCYCPTGRQTMTAWLNACQEYTWQSNI